MSPPSPGITNDVEVFPARREGLRFLVDHCASTGALAIVDQKSPFSVFLAILVKCWLSDINKLRSSSSPLHLLVLPGPPVGFSVGGNHRLVSGKP